MGISSTLFSSLICCSPERRQMNFNRIEEIAPFIRRVGGDPVAGDGACHRIDGITLFVQRQSDRRAGRTGRRHLLGVAQLGNILLNSPALIRRKLPRGSVAKKACSRGVGGVWRERDTTIR